jgi:6-phospho-beta-glucosidase
MRHSRKITIIGGGGIRTPLVVHGLIQSQEQTGIGEIAIYDVDQERVELIATLCREVARRLRGEIGISTPPRLEDAVEGASYIISSIRAGDIAARARDERLAIDTASPARRRPDSAVWRWHCERFHAHWSRPGSSNRSRPMPG